MNNPLPTPVPVREWRDVTPAQFADDIMPLGEPAILRGIVRDWPAVRAGADSPRALANYLRGFDSGAPAMTMVGDASIGGHFFYDGTMNGFNFERRMAPLSQTLDELLALIDAPAPPAVYAGALPVAAHVPGFGRDNVMPVLPPNVMGRVWVGNRVTVQTHFDLSSNVAAVVAGRRRFTLFPAEQFKNLYTGPFEFTMAGTPSSMVRPDSVDQHRFPRFRDALASARGAELAPGDALYLPYMWWHHVESLDRFNVLVNYWWSDTPPWAGTPFDALVHAIMSVKSLPPEKREVWRAAFAHYVFEDDGDPMGHFEPRERGILGPPSPQRAEAIRSYLVKALARLGGKG